MNPVETEQEEPSNEDASSQRIRELKSIVKHLLFSKENSVISKHDVEHESPEATPLEVSICLLIVVNLKKFIPEKKKYNVIAYQLYFCIFANDLLKYAGYSKFTRNLCPSSSVSGIKALHLDAPSLYQVLTRKLSNHEEPTELILYGFNAEPITSMEVARHNKDAIFCSIFDMDVVHETCKLNGLEFKQQVVLLQGMKTARILGVKKVQTTMSESKKPTYLEKVLKDSSILKEGQLPLDTLQSEVAALMQEVKELEAQFNKLMKFQKEKDFSQKLKLLRQDLRSSSNKESVYQEIVVEKVARDDTYAKINNAKRRLRQKKQILYSKRMAIRFKDKILAIDSDLTPNTRANKVLIPGQQGINRSQECTLKEPSKFVYSGTDNGLVNLTTSVPLSLDRFAFHIKLYNFYEVLQDEKKTLGDLHNINQFDESIDFLKTPQATNISASDIDVGCSYYKSRRKLKHQKASNQIIQSVEANLSKHSLNTSFSSVHDLQSNLQVHLHHQQEVRNFYSTKKIINAKRHTEIQKHRYTHTACSKERKKLSHSSGNDFFFWKLNI